MFKVIKRLNNFFLDKKLIYFLFLFFLFLKTNHILADDKIYLDLANIKFENKVNYKKYQTSSQLLIKTNLDEEIQDWVKEKIILKGNSGEFKIQIVEESIIDNFMQEHTSKFFGFITKDGIAYKINFKIKIIATNLKNNASANVVAQVNGKKTFLGGFSINERSKAIDELMVNMIKRLEINMENEINKQFKDFFANKYN